jgi:CheY-like chemotaxis protein
MTDGVEVDPRSVLWADDYRSLGSQRPEVEVWANQLEQRGFKVTTARTTGEAIKRYMHKWNPQKYTFTNEDEKHKDDKPSLFQQVVLDLNMPQGSPPQEFREYLRRVPEQFQHYLHTYSSVVAPDFLRELTGRNILVGAFSGEDPDAMLELMLHSAHFQYRLKKSSDISNVSELYAILESLQRKRPADIGLAVIVVGARNAGKSVTLRALNRMEREIPEIYTSLQNETDAGTGTYTFSTLTDARYDENERYDITDLHHTSIGVPGLGRYKEEWRRLHDSGLLVHQETVRAKEHHKIWLVKKEAVPHAKRILEELGVDASRNFPYVSLEDLLAIPTDWATVTTDIEVARQLARRYRGPKLVVRLDIPNDILADRTAHRYGMSDDARDAIKSDAFMYGTIEEREHIIRGLGRDDSRKVLVDDQGNFTDAAIRVMTNYELNEKIRNELKPDGGVIKDDEFFVLNNNSPSEIHRLTETIITKRKMYETLQGIRQKNER